MCAFCQMISRGSGATRTSRTCGLLVSGVEAAQATEERSKKLTKPVEDIVDPITPSVAWSVISNHVQKESKKKRDNVRKRNFLIITCKIHVLTVTISILTKLMVEELYSCYEEIQA